MVKIPFDIKFKPQIERGEYKVETQEGKSVRIICWDRKPLSFPISALVVTGRDSEESHCYSAQGIDKFYKDYRGCDLLIITPEPELTEFEQALETFLMNADASEQTFHEDVKKYADELLELAKKELQEKVIRDYWKQAADRCVQAREEGKAEALKEIEQDPESSYAFKRGVEYGKEEALKNLPRWKKATEKERFNERMIVLAGDNDLLCTNYAEKGEYYISFSELEKLPKED